VTVLLAARATLTRSLRRPSRAWATHSHAASRARRRALEADERTMVPRLADHLDRGLRRIHTLSRIW